MDSIKSQFTCSCNNEEEDSGIVAIPHLSRDLLACFDGNGSNFGTHPECAEGMIYKDGKYPYLYNLIDRVQTSCEIQSGLCLQYDVCRTGLDEQGRSLEAPYELLVQSYRDCMAYYAELRDKGELVDMTMAEFADWYRANKTYTQPECALWKDILYGSEKQLFWYCDPYTVPAWT